jgi:hypothetical protein
MDKAGKFKVHTVCVTIQWCEEELMPEGGRGRVALTILAEGQRYTAGVVDEAPGNMSEAGARLSGKRLLPSDRVVLNALRQRVPRGKQVTTLVRTRELEAECELSRRQVQICVKRLSEKGFIKRLSKSMDSGNTEGCRYHLSKDVLCG